MFKHHLLRQARLTAWVSLLLLVAQPVLATSSVGAVSGTGDKNQDLNRLSIQSKQRPELLMEGKPDPAIVPVWERFQRTALGEVNVHWQLYTGTPKAVYGLMKNMSATSGDPETTARSFLAQEAALFKLSSMADLSLLSESESQTGHHVFFEQRYHGLLVYDGIMDVPGMFGVHLDYDDRVHALVSSYVPGVDIGSTKPAISSETIYNRMVEELSAGGSSVKLLYEVRRELLIYVLPDGAYLAWKITVPAEIPLGTWEAFWDAETGERLSAYKDRNSYVHGTGRVFDPNAVVASGNNKLIDQNASATAVPSSAYSTVPLLDLDTSGFLTGRHVTTAGTFNRVNRPSFDFTDLDRSKRGFGEVESYWAIDDAQRYIQSFGIENAANYPIRVNVNGITDDNSFYNTDGPGRGYLVFGSGGVDDAEDAEIIWHEYGHAILDNQVPNISQNIDGMGEGWGDYWAATNAARHPSSNHALYDPAIGEWDAVSYNPGNPPYLRRVDTKAHYPEGRRSDPHITGMIWSGACWDIHNAIGGLAADHIFLEGNFLMPLAPSLRDAASAMLQANQKMNGNANHDAMAIVYQSRGLMAAPTKDSITVVSPNGGENFSVNSSLTIQWSSTGTIQSVKIEFSRDGGTTFQTVFNSTANDGDESWRVPRMATRRGVIRVSDVNEADTSDASDTTFQVRWFG